MTFEIETEKSFSENIPVREIAESVILKALEQLNCPYEVTVNLLLTDDESIRAINKETRGVDSATDVLSFPFCEFEIPGDFSAFEEQPELFHPETGELMLGDIVISVDRAKAQSEEYGHSLLREFAFLVAHSIFHLCGFDHMTPEEAKDMESRQSAVLEHLGITRD